MPIEYILGLYMLQNVLIKSAKEKYCLKVTNQSTYL